MQDAKLSITIGDDSVVYHIRQTQAPRAYDGFGTIQLYAYDGGPQFRAESFRIVLIRDEHLGWQEARYQSGMFFSTPPEHLDMGSGPVTKILWERLAGNPNS